MSNKICIYTAIYNDYENLRSHVKLDQQCDFVCFTDNPSLSSDNWDVRHLKPDIDPLMFYKKIKCYSHEYLPDYDYTIWLDANFTIINEKYIEIMFSQLKSNSLMLYKHFCLCGIFRDCLYKEAIFSRSNKKYSIASMNEQVNAYKLENYPQGNGLYQSGFLLRNNKDENVKRFNNRWFNEIIKYNHGQCQISLPYSLWKSKIAFDTIKTPIWDSSLYKIYDHKHSKVIYDNCIISKLKNSSLYDIIAHDNFPAYENLSKLASNFTGKIFISCKDNLPQDNPDIVRIDNDRISLNEMTMMSDNKYVLLLKNTSMMPKNEILNGYLTVFYHSMSKYIVIGMKDQNDVKNLKNIIGIIAYRDSLAYVKLDESSQDIDIIFEKYVKSLIDKKEKLAFYSND